MGIVFDCFCIVLEVFFVFIACQSLASLHWCQHPSFNINPIKLNIFADNWGPSFSYRAPPDLLYRILFAI